MAEKNTQARPLPPILRKTLESGLITHSAVSENRRPESSVLESINWHFDTIGSATVRKGTTALGTGLDASNVLGLFYHVDTVNAGAHTQLIAVTGTVVYYLSAGVWTSKRTGLTTGKKTRFCTFLDYVFMVNGADATAIWDGNTANSFLTTGNAASAPIGAYIENFRSRIWIAGNSTYPDRLYYSSVPSAVATPIITWNTDVATGQWIDISPSDGDQITGLQRFRNTLLVFKTNRLYRVYDISQVDPDPYYAVGTSSQESIVETKIGVFFHHASGFYHYNIYGIVQEVSRPIIDIVRGIPSSAYTSITGWIEADQDHVCWYVGDVTYRGVTYSKLVVRYTISTQTWTHYKYPTAITASIRRQPFYTDGTNQLALTGDAAGTILEMNTGLTDNTTPIQVSLIHRWDLIDGLASTRKVMETGNFLHYGCEGMEVTAQTEDQDPDDLGNWKRKIGQLTTSYPTGTGFNSMSLKARKVRFRISGQAGGGSAGTNPDFYRDIQYNGYELLDVIPEVIAFPTP